jgi:hypothetical protein
MTATGSTLPASPTRTTSEPERHAADILTALRVAGGDMRAVKLAAGALVTAGHDAACEALLRFAEPDGADVAALLQVYESPAQIPVDRAVLFVLLHPHGVEMTIGYRSDQGDLVLPDHAKCFEIASFLVLPKGADVDPRMKTDSPEGAE